MVPGPTGDAIDAQLFSPQQLHVGEECQTLTIPILATFEAYDVFPFAQGGLLEGRLQQLHPARGAKEPVDLLASLASLCDKRESGCHRQSTFADFSGALFLVIQRWSSRCLFHPEN